MGESALESGSGVGEGDADWERAHLRLEESSVRERYLDWERAHLIGWEWCGGGRHQLEESALESGSGVSERDADWERAHLRVEGNEGRRYADWERAHLRVEGNEWRRETPTGRGRT